MKDSRAEKILLLRSQGCEFALAALIIVQNGVEAMSSGVFLCYSVEEEDSSSQHSSICCLKPFAVKFFEF